MANSNGNRQRYRGLKKNANRMFVILAMYTCAQVEWTDDGEDLPGVRRTGEKPRKIDLKLANTNSLEALGFF